jgi:ABC-type sugar transport system ATPase subunit
VLILDEPTSSLTEDEVNALFGLVRRLRTQGVATIFVSHRLGEIFTIADRLTVLRDGHTVGGGLATDFDRARLIELMVGRALEHVDEDAGRGQSRDALLRVRGLTQRGAFDGVDLDVAAGEVVGLAGLVGAGRSELLEALFGLRAAEGSVELAGEQVTIRNPRDAIRRQIGFVPADRKRQGLVLDMSVRENLMMASTARTARMRYPRPARELAQVTAVIADLQIRAHSTRAPVATLSGGNQQKVVLGKWLSTQPRLLLLDEPTRGVDVGAKAEIYRLLLEASRRGIGVLVSSSEIPELLTLCDRIVVLFRGRVAAVLSRDEATEARIAHYAGGQE